MIRRAGCAELAELRSAYVDGALADRHRERLLAHLVNCADCRADVDDLRRVRRLLAAPQAPLGAPRDLSARLMSIAQEGATSRRRRLPRRTLTLLGGTATALATMGLIGFLAAPSVNARTVSDPSAEAVSEYGGMLASLPLTNQSVDAVAAIQPTRMIATPSRRPVATSGVTRQLSAQQARARLDLAAASASRVSFSGTQSYQAVRGDQQVSATVHLVNVARQGMELVVHDQRGREVSSRFVRSTSASRLSERTLVSQLAEHYTLVGWLGSEVVGRRATIIEARPAGAAAGSVAVARWWVDDSTGLLLWHETYDEGGSLQSAAGFRSLRIGRATFMSHVPQTSVPRTTTSLTLAKTSDLAAQGWSPPRNLAGLPLVRLRSDRANDPEALHLVYSDGLSLVSVFEQRGGLDGAPPGSSWDDGMRAYVRWGSASTASWESGATVLTVVSNGSPDLLAEAVRSLPHEEIPQRTTMDRVLAGWDRILGSR
ncbi:MAG TPA: zf-HC2 domain-containing protein [Microlunatus sp.]